MLLLEPGHTIASVPMRLNREAGENKKKCEKKGRKMEKGEKSSKNKDDIINDVSKC